MSLGPDRRDRKKETGSDERGISVGRRAPGRGQVQVPCRAGVGWGSIWTTGRYRRRATIDVSSGGVSTGDARYLTKEIVGFEVRAPARSLPAARVIHRRPNVVFVGDAGAVLAATAAHELASGIAGGFASGQQVGAGAREAAQRDHESACGRRGSRDLRSSREASRRTARGLLWTTWVRPWRARSTSSGRGRLEMSGR